MDTDTRGALLLELVCAAIADEGITLKDERDLAELETWLARLALDPPPATLVLRRPHRPTVTILA